MTDPQVENNPAHLRYSANWVIKRTEDVTEELVTDPRVENNPEFASAFIAVDVESTPAEWEDRMDAMVALLAEGIKEARLTERQRCIEIVHRFVGVGEATGAMFLELIGGEEVEPSDA